MSNMSERAIGATATAPDFFAELAIRMVENRFAQKKMTFDSPEMKEAWAEERRLEEIWERAERVLALSAERNLSMNALLAVLAVQAVEARLAIQGYDAAAIDAARAIEAQYAEVKQAMADGVRR